MGRPPDRRLAAQRRVAGGLRRPGRTPDRVRDRRRRTLGRPRRRTPARERLRVAAAHHRGPGHPADLVAHALAELARARRADAGAEGAADRARLRPGEPRTDVPALRGARRRREADRHARAAHVQTRTPTRRCRPRQPSSSRPTGLRRTCSSGSHGFCSTAAAARRADIHGQCFHRNPGLEDTESWPTAATERSPSTSRVEEVRPNPSRAVR